MIATTIWSQLVSTLGNNPTLSKYIKYIYEGRRFDIVPENLPCIMLEPKQNAEINRDLNQIKDLFFDVDIFSFSTVNNNDLTKVIVGDEIYKGILDIENDIRGCLVSSNTLGDNVIDIQFQPTIFDNIDMEKYPCRGLLMPIKILYRQVNGV